MLLSLYWYQISICKAFILLNILEIAHIFKHNHKEILSEEMMVISNGKNLLNNQHVFMWFLLASHGISVFIYFLKEIYTWQRVVLNEK